jgi:periplasmic protein TonB
MTAAPAGPSDPLFLTYDDHRLYRTRREAFLFSLLGQSVAVGLILLFVRSVTEQPPGVIGHLPTDLKGIFPLVYPGPSGGGGGTFDKLPASHGVLPPSSLMQLTPPTVIVPKEMPKLPVSQSVILAPEIKIPEGAQYGDPMAAMSNWLSNGRGGPSGVGDGCCNGVGPSLGPGAGPGPGGIYLAGMHGVTLPVVIYNPEPSFSDEARKSKTQGSVVLMLVVGTDGRTYDVRVQNSLGMGLDEKAIETVSTWRFHPATLNGQPVAARIAVEVNFHLY